MSDILSRGLPKWPQMLTTGMPVTTDQAKEIIRRTDSFFSHGYGGNDHAWEERLARRLRKPYTRSYAKREMSEVMDGFRKENAWRERWGCLPTQYVHNSWLSTCFIGGPHGWCHPDGRISFVDNVGKWPSIEEVLADWQAIADAFPFLDLAATLMSGEGCEDGTEPIATILVSDGQATAVPGSLSLHERFPMPIKRGNLDDDIVALLAMAHATREHGPIPEAWYDEWERMAASLFDGAPL